MRITAVCECGGPSVSLQLCVSLCASALLRLCDIEDEDGWKQCVCRHTFCVCVCVRCSVPAV